MITNPASGHTINLPELFTKAARALTGRNVVIKLESSPSRGALASLVIDPTGQPVIFIDFTLPLDARFDLLLHECAHAKLHAGSLARSNVAAMPAGSVVNQEREAKTPTWKRHESEADQLAQDWEAWADKNAWRTIEKDWRRAGFPPPVIKLLTLIERN